MECPHCRPDSFALKHALEESENFRVICDVHPLCEGHILIIPREHFSCVGGLPPALFAEFTKLYEKVFRFLDGEYGHACAFEHGKIGQTVFHCHTHLLPSQAKLTEVIPEGTGYTEAVEHLSSLPKIFNREGRYLFLAVGEKLYVVDCSLAAPRFFRDRFARLVGNAGRGDWQIMRENRVLMDEAGKEIQRLRMKWEGNA